MEEMVNLVANHGISIVIVALFLYDWFTNKKTINETLQKIDATNSNIAKSLELLQKSTERQDEKIDKILENVIKEGGK